MEGLCLKVDFGKTYDKIRVYNCEKLEFSNNDINGLEFRIPIKCESRRSIWETKSFECNMVPSYSEAELKLLAHSINKVICDIYPPMGMKLLITYFHNNEFTEIVADKIQGKYILSPFVITKEKKEKITSYIKNKTFRKVINSNRSQLFEYKVLEIDRLPGLLSIETFNPFLKESSFNDAISLPPNNHDEKTISVSMIVNYKNKTVSFCGFTEKTSSVYYDRDGGYLECDRETSFMCERYFKCCQDLSVFVEAIKNTFGVSLSFLKNNMYIMTGQFDIWFWLESFANMIGTDIDYNYSESEGYISYEEYSKRCHY